MQVICRLFLLCALWIAGALPAAAQSSDAGKTHIAATLIAESDTPASGQTVAIAFVMRPETGWHGYWENPGDAGLGMTLSWDLPDGVEAGALDYPVPETLLISGIMNHVYEEDYAVLGALTLPAGLTKGARLPITVKADWLACTDQLCVPETARLTLDLTVGDGTISPDRRVQFDGYRARLPRPLNAQVRYTSDGDRFRLAIPFPSGAQVDSPWFFAQSDGIIDYAAPQQFSSTGDMLILEGKARGAPDSTVAGVIRTGQHIGFSFIAEPGQVPAAGEPLERTGGTDASGSGLRIIMLALGGAIIGGLLLNIMPCVFPILSLKALSLAKAGHGGGAAQRDALAYMAGAILTCIALGVALLALRAGGEAVGWAFQLQRPEIILILFVLVVGISLNLAGLFELGSVTAGGSLAERGGVSGSFWTGALAAFVATPCTGPFMGAALGAALVLPVAAALAVFAGLGFGLALPFVLIAFVPALAQRLPKPGPWMATFRHIMAVPMFLTALALAWLLGRQAGTEAMSLGLLAALVVGLGLWWIGARQRHGRGRAGSLAIVGVALLVVAAVALVTGPQRTTSVEPGEDGSTIAFDEGRLAALRAADTPVFLYFTADWCITCKANEAAAINRDEVRQAFDKAGVQVMVGDWTNADAAISRFLAAHGRSGVPLYLWYAPGKDVQTLPQILTPALLVGLTEQAS
ncbi:MAG: protein-disulfide reductase DsbD family protein [Sphingobium sp.]